MLSSAWRSGTDARNANGSVLEVPVDFETAIEDHITSLLMIRQFNFATDMRQRRPMLFIQLREILLRMVVQFLVDDIQLSFGESDDPLNGPDALSAGGWIE
jgi:hypothetical protein